MLNLPRTKRALGAYDAHQATWGAVIGNPKVTDLDILRFDSVAWRLAREVGRAFGLDTADRNAMDTCEGFIAVLENLSKGTSF